MTKPLAGKRILISNDDGINAPGLAVMEKIADELSDDIWIVAPETEQSGASHSLTLHMPLRLRKLADRRYAVQGTPTDCVMMAIKQIMPDRKPDLILSGVNNGQNMAEDVTYSGTVAAAMEGTSLGIPSIALSQSYGIERTRINWDVTATHAPGLVLKLVRAGWPTNVLININFPDTETDKVGEIMVTRQGKRGERSINIIERKDGRGFPYFWLGFRPVNSNPPVDTDLAAIYAGNISVTPLHMNLTGLSTLATVRSAIEQE